MRLPWYRDRVVVTCVVLAVIWSGCSRHLGADIAGVVTIGGQPATSGKVMFQPVSGGAVAAGIIQADGRYRVQTASTMSLKPGVYRVAVVVVEGDASTGASGKVRWLVDRRYASPDTSGLEERIGRGHNTVDFHLPAAD